MQTFLPYPDFAATARVLDARRLGKQRVEALQVFRGLTVPGYGWRHHPAVKMWIGYPEALVRYALEMCREWSAAGRADTVAATLAGEYGGTPRGQDALRAAGELPPWLGSEDLHLSHRSSLLRKDPGWYRPIFGDLPDDLPYVWPASDRPNDMEVTR
ncbi:MAG TPA: MSMEG_6728 family protein [Micromonosporaceae bacterium]|nr:MSMEG_6728 family protein [Micromonosporaceae bacterium]